MAEERRAILVVQRDGVVVPGTVLVDTEAASSMDYYNSLRDYRDDDGNPIETGDATIQFPDGLPMVN